MGLSSPPPLHPWPAVIPFFPRFWFEADRHFPSHFQPAHARLTPSLQQKTRCRLSLPFSGHHPPEKYSSVVLCERRFSFLPFVARLRSKIFFPPFLPFFPISSHLLIEKRIPLLLLHGASASHRRTFLFLFSCPLVAEHALSLWRIEFVGRSQLF